ncbi:interferon gamma 1-like [Acipenser ruthenus]|uniref:IFN gamma1-like protein n=1 Tax=Acipenser ruthenus TaxID=7906 RepID=A0AAU7YAI6_ACIRT|nr:interferon gamma 1-like [Acipenser ruthenus]
MNSLQSLLLLNAIGLVTFGCVYSSEVISDYVKNDILQLEEHYKTNDPILAGGGPLFLNFLKYFDKQESGDKILLNEIVNVYIDILKNMKDTTEDQRSKNSIQHVYREMERLRFASGTGTLKEELKKLWEIKKSDPIVQRKAMLELKQVLEKAMRIEIKLQKNVQRRRRRRVNSP